MRLQLTLVFCAVVCVAHASMLCIDRAGQTQVCRENENCANQCFKYLHGSSDRLIAAGRLFGGQSSGPAWNGNVTVDWNVPGKRVCFDENGQVLAPQGMCQSSGMACFTIQCRSPCFAPNCMCRTAEAAPLEKQGRCIDLSLNQLWALAEFAVAL